MNKALPVVIILVLIIGAAVYYQQHTHTASIDLPGGHDVSVTTHD